MAIENTSFRNLNSPPFHLRDCPQILRTLPKYSFPVSLSNPRDETALFVQNHCRNEGVLMRERGFVYLKLDENYLDGIFEQIKTIDPEVRPPIHYYGVGPHISVIRHNEWKGAPPKQIDQIAKKYLFTPLRCEEVVTGRKRLWVLVVEPSPELGLLRKIYGLSNRPYGKEFHITIAQK